MRLRTLYLLVLPVLAYSNSSRAVDFEKIVLTDKYYCDGITAADINSDGRPDIVAGPFWYEGPDFKLAHAFYEPVLQPLEESPSNSMFSFVHDFSGDGRPDILVLGRVHKHAAMWYENPGESAALWKSHFAFERVRGESPTLADLNGDGVPQLICHWDGRWGYIQPDPETPAEPWAFTPIGEDEDWPQFYHGEGVGDVNSDGRLDVIINDGWYEHPPASITVNDGASSESSSVNSLWKFHRLRFSQERGGAQMFAYDVDADGDQDVISAVHAHEWGLAWYENETGDATGPFRERLIMGNREQLATYKVAFTQPHALALADINGDGLQDIITGKRRWAHGPTGDIEPNADPVVYWFQLKRNADGSVQYVPHLIDHNSGVGVQIAVQDVNSDSRIDVLTSSKLGSFLFLNTDESQID
ncbi:MAG: VCBS repeat-containing protein [Fuerstiella sp.]|jgi:hypothetical protein|nr:VCBS repeat-containing protein [Fuerstiella sp.]